MRAQRIVRVVCLDGRVICRINVIVALVILIGDEVFVRRDQFIVAIDSDMVLFEELPEVSESQGALSFIYYDGKLQTGRLDLFSDNKVCGFKVIDSNEN